MIGPDEKYMYTTVHQTWQDPNKYSDVLVSGVLFVPVLAH